MSAPGVGPITALAVTAAFDDAGRFRSSASAGASLGLTLRRYESGEISRNGRISKRGGRMARTHLYEAANAIVTRKLGGSRLRDLLSQSPSAPGRGRPRSPWRASWR